MSPTHLLQNVHTGNDREIAQRVIEKAIKNGFVQGDCHFDQVNVTEALGAELYCRTHNTLELRALADILFDEGDNFAKSFWGWGQNHTKHMQALSRAKNPYKYLERFL